MRATPLLTDIVLRRFQQVIWELLGENNLLILPRRHGKSFLMATIAAFLLLTTEAPIQIIVLAPTRLKARDLLFQMVKSLLESEQTSYIKFLKSELHIINEKTNARMMFFACSPEHGSSIRGHYANVLIADELAEMSGKEFTESALPTLQGVPAETAHIRCLVMSGTPLGSSSLLTQLYSKYHALAPKFPLSYNEKDLQSPIPMEAYQLAAQSKYRLFHLPFQELGIFTPEQLAPDRLIMGEAQFQREYEVSLSATADDVLFRMDDLMACASDDLTPDNTGHIQHPDRSLSAFRPPSAGLDIARSNDATMLYIRQGHAPLFLGRIKTPDSNPLNKTNMDQQIEKIIKVLLRYSVSDVSADAGGLGQFFVDELESQLLSHNIAVHKVQGQQATPYAWKEEFINTRTCLYGLLAHAVAAHTPLPNVPELMEELSANTLKEQPHDSRKALIPKKDVKARINRSPDTSDAVVLSYYTDAQYDQEHFMATLQDIRNGTIHVSSEELLQQIPKLIDNTRDQNNPFFSSSLWEELTS